MSIRVLFANHESITNSLDNFANNTTATKPEPAKPAATSSRPKPKFDLPNLTIPQGEVIEEKTWPWTTAVPVPYDAVPSEEYVAVCMSIKDQSRDMNEFFTHHYYHHNIRRFYIMDDGSDPPLSSFEYPGVPRSALTFTYEDRKTRVQHMQMMFYSWCMERYADKHKWIAFLDGDEYIETPGSETFQEVLESFEHNDTVGALGINWKVHTSSGVKTRPPSARKAFDVCAFDGKGSINTHIKVVVKTSLAAGPLNPHKFRLKNGAETVGENGDIINTVAFREPITRARVGLHHYAIKSLEEFEEKLHRGNGMTDPQSRGVWEKVEYEMDKVNCTEIVNYDP
ncbi:hypothetical protein BDZ45DRAFT_589913 [Acephala macrosclerotiorum]|nr:hypothetical protein BDZ45DRAFT_589913 [Acephala macrosclerotiorum]